MRTGSFVKTLGILALGGLTACASPKVSQEVEMPAREHGMVNAKKIAVFNIDGDQDRNFTGKVESYLANIKVRGKPYFEVLERDMLSRIVREQKMVSTTGLFNERDAAKLGGLAGADTLIMGGVRMPSVSERHYRKPEEYCAGEIDKKTKKCTYTRTRYHSCVEKQANVDYTLKAVSVQTGSIIFTKSYSGKAADDYCQNQSGSAKSPTDLQNIAVAGMLDGLRKDVAPYTVMVTIQFMEKDDTMNSATKGKIKSALEFVEHKRVDRACAMFKEALASDTNSPALYYNAGVCAEIGGDLDSAEAMYDQADKKAKKPIGLVNTAIARVKESRANAAAVSKQVRQ